MEQDIFRVNNPLPTKGFRRILIIFLPLFLKTRPIVERCVLSVLVVVVVAVLVAAVVVVAAVMTLVVVLSLMVVVVSLRMIPC